MMRSLFDLKIFDNTLGSYLLVTGIILLAISLKRFISRHVAGLAFGVVKRAAAGVARKNFIALVVSPLENFVLILAVLISLDRLRYPSVLEVSVYKVSLRGLLDTAAVLLMVGSFIWLLLRMIDFVAMILEEKANMSHSQTDNQLVVFFKDFFKVLLVLLGVLMILKFGFHFKIASLVTGLSLAGAAVALATRESIENLIASFIIFFDRPFSTGDLIRVQNITGTVEKIGLRSTRLRTTQKSYVTVPNKQMVDSIMDNLSLQTQRRAFVQLELASDTPHETVLAFVAELDGGILARNERIENHSVFLADIVKNAYIVTIEFFTATIPVADFNAVRQQVNLAAIALMEKLGISLAKEAEKTS